MAHKKVSKSPLAIEIGTQRWLADYLLEAVGQGATDEQRKAYALFRERADVVQRNLDYADRFNQLFGQRGWIAHESMQTPLLLEAVELAESEALDQAEVLLTTAHDPDAVGIRLRQLSRAYRFKPRMKLLELALEDCRADRYHACIPVVLMMIDGITVEVSENRKGLFDRSGDFFRDDSIVGHGLPLLKQLLTTGCNQTNSKQAKIPLRHGILHGRLLGYANHLVAAKTWALLFYIHDWLVTIEPSSKAKRR